MSRLKPTDRKQQILEAATEMSKKSGYQNVTRDAVAAHAECSPALVSAYFNTMHQLRRAVMRYAVSNRVLPVIAQGLVAKDAQALKAPDDVKRAALAQLSHSL